MSIVWYSERHDVAVIHIHKTGGLSLQAALVGAIPDLQTLAELPHAHHRLEELFGYLEARGKDPLATTVVAGVCHPAAHAVSIYEFWRSPKTDNEAHLGLVALTRQLDFPDFLEKVLIRDQFAESLLVDDELPPNVHLVHRERLAEETSAFLEGVMGHRVDVALPHLNRTRHGPVAGYFEEHDVLERLRRSYEWTFSQGLYRLDDLPSELPTSRWSRVLPGRLFR